MEMLSSDPLLQQSVSAVALPQTGGAWVSHSGHQTNGVRSVRYASGGLPPQSQKFC